jgi:hypothetical protein
MRHAAKVLLPLMVLGFACSQNSNSGGTGGAPGGGSGGSTGGAGGGTGGSSGGGTGGSTSTGGSGGAGGTAGAGGAGGSGGAGGAGGTGGTVRPPDSAATGGAVGADAGRLDAAPDAAGVPRDGGAMGNFSFFVTSTGSGAMGGNLGQLTGADAKCQTLATAVGAGGRMWHAYLSVSGPTPVNARDRIGAGPWFNINGVRIATDLANLHETAGMNGINAQTAVDERGTAVPQGEHDILTGSALDGTAFPAVPDRTCAGWTSSQAGTAQVGHENRMGTSPPPNTTSWNSAHFTPDCTQAMIARVAGAGRLYCFAID